MSIYIYYNNWINIIKWLIIIVIIIIVIIIRIISSSMVYVSFNCYSSQVQDAMDWT